MYKPLTFAFCLLATLGALSSSLGAPRVADSGGMGGQKTMKSLIGKWKGTCRTWLRPGQLSEESEMKGEFSAIEGTQVIRHTYQSTIMGEQRTGEELIAFNAVESTYQVSWIDTFHMNYAILFSEGKATDHGFSVKANYRMAANQELWGWRTEFESKDDDHLTITSYNITPDGREGKGVEVQYTRMK